MAQWARRGAMKNRYSNGHQCSLRIIDGDVRSGMFAFGHPCVDAPADALATLTDPTAGIVNVPNDKAFVTEVRNLWAQHLEHQHGEPELRPDLKLAIDTAVGKVYLDDVMAAITAAEEA